MPGAAYNADGSGFSALHDVRATLISVAAPRQIDQWIA